MKAARWIAALALIASGHAWSQDAAGEGRPHTHWWLELGDSLASQTWYAGAGAALVAYSDWSGLDALDDGSYSSRNEDDQASSFRVFGGVEFGYFGLEAGYSDFGRASFVAQSDGSGTLWAAGPQRESYELAAYDLNLIGRLPVSDPWKAFIRLGAAFLNIDAHFSGETQPGGPFDFGDSSHPTELSYGAGLEYRGIEHWRLVGTWQHLEFENEPVQTDPKLDSFSLSVAYVWGASQP